MSTRILWLPADPLADATCFHLDHAGLLLAPAVPVPVPAHGADARPPFAGAPRTVLVVPGAEVRVDWLELPARSGAQALAAARALLAGRLAHPGDLHVALAPEDGRTLRMAVAMDPRHLRQWLDRAVALGMRADAVVPEQLLLPVPPEGDAGDAVVCVFDAGDRWLARGTALAFSAEPALAAQVLAGRMQMPLPADSRDALAARAVHPGMDLLQGGFAPATARARPAARRRLAWLAAALLASPLLLVAAQALRLELAAHSLEARTAERVQHALPDATGSSTDAAALHARIRAGQAPRAFVAASGALFSAVSARAGTHLSTLDYQRGDPLRATLFHSSREDIEAIRGALSADGWQLVDGGSSDAPGGLLTVVVLEPGA